MVHLNPTEKQILAIVREWQEKYHNSPTVAELARLTGHNYSTIRMAVYRLQEKDYLQLEKPLERLLIILLAGA